ncbi:fumarylacetoacetate hydrolase family protein [Shewanella aestuarii]|uniref:Hydratase n=1 Tax=Shewanella aestuarii TaxID=1028752 RepID=A0A6G9QJQ2_9GAMM|nr:fumarylacetoacetate hydrolase family protein [Shewanella aestuarii]QIR14091.1 hydratase [Shewanella aestuarii]
MTEQAALKTLASHLMSQRTALKPASELAAIAPQSIDDAFYVQQQMIKLFGKEIAGWKCLVPQPNDQLIFAPILADAVVQQAACPMIAHRTTEQSIALIEPEIAFVLGQDIAPNQQYTDAQIDAAMSGAFMALELIQLRFSQDYSASNLEKLADGLSNQGIYIGPEIDIQAVYQASEVSVEVTESPAGGDEQTQHFDGKHPCGLPQSPIYWLVNYLASKGVGLKKGQAIITGSYAGVVKVAMNTPVTIRYEGLGEFQVNFEDKL